jgi:hypothetical protein
LNANVIWISSLNVLSLYYYHHRHYHQLSSCHCSLAAPKTVRSLLNFLTVRHVFSVTAFCIRIYRADRRFSSFILPCNLFRIITVVDITNVITLADFRCRILVSSSFKSVYFCSFTVMCCENCDLEIAALIKYVSLLLLLL